MAKQSLPDNFNQRTPEQVNDIKRKVCVAHKCPYLSCVDKGYTSYKSNSDGWLNTRCCNYILLTGHMRNYNPEDCKHWKDKVKKKKARGIALK